MGDLLGVGIGQQLHQTADHGGVVALHQAEGCFQIMIGLGRGEVEGQVELAVLEAGGLLPDGADHLLAGSGQRLVVHGQDFVDDGFIVVPGHGGVDEAALHQGLVCGSQNAVGHLLGTGIQGGIVGGQGVEAVGQLAEAVVQRGNTGLQLGCTIQQSQRTAGQLRDAVFQLRRTVHELAHGVVQLLDAVGQLVDAVEVKDIVRAQRIGAGGCGQHDLRSCQIFHIGFHGHAVLQIIFHRGQVLRQQAGQRILHAGQGDERGHVALGGRLDHAVLSGHIGGVLTKDDAHRRDERSDDGAVGAVDIHGAGLVVGQVDLNGQVAALAHQVLQAVGHAIQRIGDFGRDG